MKIKYLNIKQHFISGIFEDIGKLVAYDGTIPLYNKQINSIKKLEGILELSRNDSYYPDFRHKASAIYLGILKGHFFCGW
mgnify:CR=1 FL=1